ncbi:MAG: PEP-CTERM sorting domain-containing protein [Phycisphaerales bacterium]
MNRGLSAAVVALCASSALAQTAGMPPHAAAFTGSTRGYWFTAPVDFRMTGVQVLQNPATANAFMNWSVVRFDANTPPPTFPLVTNAFQQLAFGLNQPSGAFAPVSLDILAGQVIGIYGNTTATAGTTTGINSYTATLTTATTSIFGNIVNLTRSGMQFHLGSATSPLGMHDIWQELTSTAVSRTQFTYTEIPAPASMALVGLGGLAAARRRR